MGKFTSSNLFAQNNNNNNNESVPSWMNDLADNLEVKQKEVINWESEKRGVFAESQQVYRPEVTADPRSMMNRYSETKLITESKISLAKFLSGKYYKVVNANTGVNYVTLNVKLDSVAAEFQFPYEVNNSGRMVQAGSFYANEGEYPFSKAGFEDCLADIKAGRIKTSSTAEAVGKAFLINREEIVRRYNGHLRPATDKINQLLSEGVIIGAGSNTYASFHDVDQLFPQMEKEASDEKMGEFHFTPNQERVASAEYKTASYLSLDASKILSDYFDDYKILQSNRDNNELLVKATILGKNGIRKEVDFSFAIENEKVAGVKIAEINDNRMTITQLMDHLSQIDNTMLNRYLINNKTASKHIYSGVILTKKDINAKLLKVVESSKVENVIKNWILGGMLTPVNSTTYATEYSFQELLANANEETLTDDQVDEINAAQSHFGEGLDIETDLEKPVEKYRDIEDTGSEELMLVNANTYLSKHLQRYTIASAKKQSNSYVLDVNFINTKTGTRHGIPFTFNFEGTKVKNCTAQLGKRTITIDKLLSSFASNQILSLYLQNNSSNLVAGPIVITESNMKRKLASVVTASSVDSIIEKWVANGTVSRIAGNTLASSNSFEELLTKIDSNFLISEAEIEAADYQKQHFGKNLKVKTDDITEDTGVREAEEQAWGAEKKQAFAANEIGKMFKDYRLVSSSNKDENNFVTTATVINPISGSRTNLTFRFPQEDGKLKSVVAVSDTLTKEEVSIDKIVDLLEKQTSEASKLFAAQNKVSEKIHAQKLISKAHLTNKLKTVASVEYVSEIINNLVEWNALKPINSATFSSLYTVAELVDMADSRGKTDLKAAKEQMEISAARSNEQTISFSNKVEMNTDSRELNQTVRELTPQMIEAKNRLVSTIKKASENKKITSSKANLLVSSLNEAKTSKDLELVARDLKRYLD